MWGCQVTYIPTRFSDKTKLPVSPKKLHLPPNGLKNATSTMTVEAHETTKVESPAVKRKGYTRKLLGSTSSKRQEIPVSLVLVFSACTRDGRKRHPVSLCVWSR